MVSLFRKNGYPGDKWTLTEQSRLLQRLVETLVVTTNGVDLQLRVRGLGALVNELANH